MRLQSFGKSGSRRYSDPENSRMAGAAGVAELADVLPPLAPDFAFQGSKRSPSTGQPWQCSSSLPCSGRVMGRARLFSAAGKLCCAHGPALLLPAVGPLRRGCIFNLDLHSISKNESKPRCCCFSSGHPPIPCCAQPELRDRLGLGYCSVRWDKCSG